MYNELIKDLMRNIPMFRRKTSHEPLKQMLQVLKQPQNDLKCIHIAGTNGKGSVCTKIAHGLQLSGYRVGLLTSPHLISFRERFRINGQLVDKQTIVNQLIFLQKIAEQNNIKPLFFEYITLLGFLIFKEFQVDYAVIETGLGGLYDSTNCIQKPELVVISNIAYDHTEILGNSLEEIAFQKAGIIKQGVSTIIGPNAQPLSVFQQVCEAKQSELIQVQQQEFSSYNEENTFIAQAALQQLNLQIPFEKLLPIKPPCRFQQFILPNQKEVIFDVAHNTNGFDKLVEQIKKIDKQKWCLIGFGMKKQVEEILKIVDKNFERIFLVQAKHFRAKKIQEIQVQNVKQVQIISNGDIFETIKYIQKEIDDQVLVCCGSFFIFTELMKSFNVFYPNYFDLEDEDDMSELPK